MPPVTQGSPRAIVISGPSGYVFYSTIPRLYQLIYFRRSGKSTLISELFKEYPTAFAFSVSRTFFFLIEYIHFLYFSSVDTTRAPRPGEQNGRGRLNSVSRICIHHSCIT